MVCPKCSNSGFIDTGNNDLPCDCPIGSTTIFNEAGVGAVTGEEIRQHYLNGSPEPLEAVPDRGNALVVDDDDQTREYVAKALQKGGFKVTTARDGVEGRARFHEREEGFFDIIVSDWSMPRLMGTNMVRSIRRYDKNQKVLMMSSDPEMVRRQLQDMRITNVLVLHKSFTSEGLVREVLNVINGVPCEFAR